MSSLSFDVSICVFVYQSDWRFINCLSKKWLLVALIFFLYYFSGFYFIDFCSCFIVFSSVCFRFILPFFFLVS